MTELDQGALKKENNKINNLLTAVSACAKEKSCTKGANVTIQQLKRVRGYSALVGAKKLKQSENSPLIEFLFLFFIF